MSNEILQQELLQQINEYRLKGLSLVITLHLLIIQYNSKLCERGFNRNARNLFKTKKNIIQNIITSAELDDVKFVKFP